MERKSPKCPPMVEPKEFGCVWSFSGMFDHHHHHHHRPHRKLLSDDSHGSKNLSGNRNAKKQERMLTFDEQLRNITTESKKKREASSSNDEIWENNVERSFWKKIISRNKKDRDPNFTDRIVVLKPIQRVIESPVDVGCRCTPSRQQIVKLKHTQVSFNDVRKELKTAKKMNNRQKMNNSKLEKLSLVKKREPDVFVEARRHLAERLKQIAMGEVEASTSFSNRASRTLERVLLSSPIHDYSVDVSSPITDCKAGSLEEKSENPSPVSVLDPFFAVELHLQPRRLDFEEHSSQASSPHQKPNLSSCSSMEDQEFVYSYINTIYQHSQSNWEEFLASDYPSESSCDHKLLHDCLKELLIGLHSQVTKIRPLSYVVDEVIEQVDWHNGQPEVPRTLDTLVRRDIAKSGRWVDAVLDRNEIVFEVVDETLDELIMEVMSDVDFSV